MADFSLASCHKYWYEYSDPNVYRALCAMESVEHWTLDGDPEIESSISEMGQNLDAIREMTDEMRECIVYICAYIKSARVLMILQTFDSLSPGAASQLIQFAENLSDQKDFAKLFVNRNIIFERYRLLNTVLSNDRLELISNAMEKIHDND